MTYCKTENCKGHYVINGHTGDLYGLVCNVCGDRRVMDMHGNIAPAPSDLYKKEKKVGSL